MRRRRFSDDRGNVAVEFALVLPVFLMLLMGLVDYGRAARERSMLEAAARAGIEAVRKDADNAEGAADAVEVMLNANGYDLVEDDIDVTLTTECTCPDGTVVSCSNTCSVGNRRQVVTIEVERSHTMLVPWPGLPDPLTLTAIAQMRVR